jgi:hypothetical protein
MTYFRSIPNNDSSVITTTKQLSRFIVEVDASYLISAFKGGDRSL